MKLSELFLNRFLYRDNSQNMETKGADFNSLDSSDTEPTPIPSGGAAQDINTSNILINGGQLEPGTFPTTVLDVSNWGWTQSCVFSSTDADTVSWGAGTFISADGTSYSIDAGSTGNMGGKTYIYLSLLSSETVYNVSSVAANSVGLGKVLIAVAENAADSATYNLSEASQIVGDNILANTINASKIITGQLVVGTNVGLGSAFPSASAGDLAYQDLVGAALLDNTVIVGGYIKTSLLTADNITTGTLTGITITGNLIRTSASGLRVEMTSTDTNKISFYNSAVPYGEIEVSYSSPNGYIKFLTQDGNGLTMDTDIAVSGYNSCSLSANGGIFDTYGNASNGFIGMVAGSSANYIGIARTAGPTYELSTDMSFIPSSDSNYNIGSTGVRWAAGFFDLVRCGTGIGTNAIFSDTDNVVPFTDAIKLSQLISDPSSGGASADGVMYYNVSSNLFRIRINGTWRTVTTS